MSRARSRRAILLFFVGAVFGGFAFVPSLREPVRGVLREAVGFRRVEQYSAEIQAAAREQQMEPALIAAVVYVESTGRLSVVSEAGAMGLMQLMPAAASDAAKALELTEPTPEELLSDAALNLRLGARHLAWTLDAEGGDLERALVAYNAGRGRLGRWVDEQGSYALWRKRALASGNSPTLAYAWRVLAYRDTFRTRSPFREGPLTPSELKDA
ncbi:MAG: lytic transglycosylase domain-containing protein [Planctomycetes bacterium]|nr:lytic transglycosylase domain-containing protein [Planctomycetota bacterium]